MESNNYFSHCIHRNRNFHMDKTLALMKGIICGLIAKKKFFKWFKSCPCTFWGVSNYNCKYVSVLNPCITMKTESCTTASKPCLSLFVPLEAKHLCWTTCKKTHYITLNNSPAPPPPPPCKKKNVVVYVKNKKKALLWKK